MENDLEQYIDRNRLISNFNFLMQYIAKNGEEYSKLFAQKKYPFNTNNKIIKADIEIYIKNAKKDILKNENDLKNLEKQLILAKAIDHNDKLPIQNKIIRFFSIKQQNTENIKEKIIKSINVLKQDFNKIIGMAKDEKNNKKLLSIFINSQKARYSNFIEEFGKDFMTEPNRALFKIMSKEYCNNKIEYLKKKIPQIINNENQTLLDSYFIQSNILESLDKLQWEISGYQDLIIYDDKNISINLPLEYLRQDVNDIKKIEIDLDDKINAIKMMQNGINSEIINKILDTKLDININDEIGFNKDLLISKSNIKRELTVAEYINESLLIFSENRINKGINKYVNNNIGNKASNFNRGDNKKEEIEKIFAKNVKNNTKNTEYNKIVNYNNVVEPVKTMLGQMFDTTLHKSFNYDREIKNSQVGKVATSESDRVASLYTWFSHKNKQFIDKSGLTNLDRERSIRKFENGLQPLALEDLKQKLTESSIKDTPLGEYVDLLSQFQIVKTADNAPDKDKNIGNLLQEIGGLVNQYNNSKNFLGLGSGGKKHIEEINQKIDAIKTKIDLNEEIDPNKDLKESIVKELGYFSAKIQEFNLKMLDPRDNLTHFNNLKFNIYDKLGKDLEKIQARTADEQLLELFELPVDNKNNAINVEIARKVTANILEKVIKYLEKIDEKELKNIKFSNEVIDIFKKELTKKYMDGLSLVGDEEFDISNQLENFCTKLLEIKNRNKDDILKDLRKIEENLGLKQQIEKKVPSSLCRQAKLINLRANSEYRIETDKDKNQKGDDLQLRIYEKDEIIGVIEILDKNFDVKKAKEELYYFERDDKKIFYINNNISIYCDMKENDKNKDQVNITFANIDDKRDIYKKLDVVELKFNQNEIISKKSDYPCYLNNISNNKLICQIYQNNKESQPISIQCDIKNTKYTDLNKNIQNIR